MAFLPSWYGLLCSLIVINVLFDTGVFGSPTSSNPLEADDILKKHTFGNHLQCQRLCWYIELCERFSFYTKNLDDAHPYNCVLHAGEEKDDDVSDGWMQEKASGDYLPSKHGCRYRTCGKEKVCIPVAMPDVKNVCNDLPADVNECASSPCQNGTCVDGDRAYTCYCFPGYTGSHCETDIDECASNPCQNNGSCVDQVNAYTCNCSAGYNESHCETDIDECASSPCQNGGSCVDQVNAYTCNCSAGYNGSNCETDINECASSPCQNGGSCVDQVNAYTCNCSAGYNGSNCETDIDECASSPCQNGGSCVDQVNAYTCNCSAGYNGSNCETDIDECASSPCQNGGSCVDQVNAYTCNCSAGYNGSNCETDIDECASNPCQNGRSCVDQVNNYTCNCPAGYTGDHCETDVDECESNPCMGGESCQDEVNGYTCCPPGYTGNNCSETWVNETCPMNRTCTTGNTTCYSEQCLCNDGFFFSHSKKSCVTDCTFTENDTYLPYPDLDPHGDVDNSTQEANATLCALLCNIRPHCRVFTVRNFDCWLKNGTTQEYPNNYWTEKQFYDSYQRTCL